MDKYSNFQHMKKFEREGIDYHVGWRIGSSGIAILCIHGGNIEPGTSQIAVEIAGNEHTLYVLEGLKTSGNMTLHITSTAFDEPIALDIVCRSEMIITVHGCAEKEAAVYLGGLDRELKNRIRNKLKAAGFQASETANSELQGVDRANICNLCGRGMGVQLEISRGLRSQLFADLTPEGREHPTEAFYRFVGAIREALEPFKRPAEEWPETSGCGAWP